MTPKSDKTIADIIFDPGVHDWVKDVLPVLLNRDPVDVLHDLTLLAAVFQQRFDEILQERVDSCSL